jgi:hypothetical protein
LFVFNGNSKKIDISNFGILNDIIEMFDMILSMLIHSKIN